MPYISQFRCTCQGSLKVKVIVVTSKIGRLSHKDTSFPLKKFKSIMVAIVYVQPHDYTIINYYYYY